MNPKKSFESGLPRLLLTAVCACFLTAIPAAAQITVVNTGSATRTTSSGGQSFNINFNAGATADAILLSLSSESNAAAGQVSISYAGFPFTPVIDHIGTRPSVWLLNLSDTTYTGGTATLVLNLTNVAVANGYGLGIVSVNTGHALLDRLGVHASNTSTATSVGLTTTLESFAIAGHYVNLSSGGATAPAPMTQLYGAPIGSARGAAGYRASLAAGTASFLFGSTSGTDGPRSSAAAFVPVSLVPVLLSTVPADNAPAFPVSSNLVATFSEAVLAGTGNIELWQVGGGSPVESFVVTSSTRLTFSGSTLTIEPTAALTPGVGYFVLIAPTAVVDANTNAFAGISDPTAWNFTTDTTGAIFDDFNDGNDNGWTRQSPLTLLGAPAVFSFPGGNSYQIHANPQTVGAQYGPARAGSLRLDQSYASYFQQSVDLVDWDNSQSGLTIGMLARTSNPGLGSTNGYSLTITLGGLLEIFRVTNEAPVSPAVATASIGALSLANDYRLVFTGDGSVLTGQIFNLADLATPLATISGNDATYASGNSGLMIYSSSGTQTVTATFDNYASGRFGTPIAKANNSNNLDLGSSWVGGVVPTSADRATWDSTVTGATTVSLGADLTFGGIVIADPAGPVTIQPGHTLALGAGLVDIDLSAATQDLTLNCDLAMEAANLWDVTSGRTLVLGGVVSGSAPVTKLGAGTAILANANTYTGKTTITAGTLQLSGAGTLGAPGATTAVSSGALLDLNGTNQSIAFAAGTGVGTVANNSGSGTSTLTLAGTPTINGSLVTIDDHTTTPGGKVAVVITANTQPMSNLNTYSGGTTVNAGAFFYLNAASPLGAGTGTINLPASGGSTALSSGLLVDGATYANDVSGAGYIHNNVNGAATAVLTGTLNTSGTFNFRNAAAAFDFAGSGNSTLSGVIGPAGGNGVFGPNTTVSTGSIIKSGTGTLTLSGANLYTGSTTVNAGTLALVGGSQRSPITVAGGASLGFTLGSPTTSTSTVNLTNGTVKITGTPTLASYTLLSASSITPVNPVLDSPISGYQLVVEDGKILMLVSLGVPDYPAWASNFPTADLSDPNADYDGDGVSNDAERIFGLDPTNPASVNPISVPLDPAAGTLSFTRRDPALSGLIYLVWTSTDLVAWTEDEGAVLTPGAVVNEVQTVAVQLSAELLDEPRLFVRLGAVMPEPPPPLLSADFK